MKQRPYIACDRAQIRDQGVTKRPLGRTLFRRKSL